MPLVVETFGAGRREERQGQGSALDPPGGRAPWTLDRFAFGMYPRGTVSPHLQDGKDLDQWDVTLTVPIRFNRLALYNASLYHRNATTWGRDAQDARLVQSFFFSTRPEGAHLPEWMR